MNNLLLFLSCIIFLFSTCKVTNHNVDDLIPVPIRVVSVKHRDVADEIRGFGSLSYYRKIDLAAPSDSVLERLYFREGDHVAAGKITASLKNPQINLAVQRAENGFAQANASLELAKARLIRGEFMAETKLLENEKAESELALAMLTLEEQRRKLSKDEILHEAGGLTEEAILESRFSLVTFEEKTLLMEKELELRKIGLRPQDLISSGITLPDDETELRRALVNFYISDLRAEYNSAESYVKAAAGELESTGILKSELTVISPIGGIVAGRYFEEGERLKREDKIMTIIDTSSLYALFPVSESDSTRISRGMNAIVNIEGISGKYNGIVDLVYPQGDSQTFSFLARVIIDSGDSLKIKPGMFSKITIPMENPNAVMVIPETSLVSKNGNQAKVFSIQGKHLREKKVTIGRILGDEREILAGLEKDEVLALRPDTSYKDGQYVAAHE